jgi:hypothetical protein
MNAMIIIGIVLGAGTGVVNRYFCKLPDWLAIILYTIAVIAIIAGMIIARKPA